MRGCDVEKTSQVPPQFLATGVCNPDDHDYYIDFRTIYFPAPRITNPSATPPTVVPPVAHPLLSVAKSDGLLSNEKTFSEHIGFRGKIIGGSGDYDYQLGPPTPQIASHLRASISCYIHVSNLFYPCNCILVFHNMDRAFMRERLSRGREGDVASI